MEYLNLATVLQQIRHIRKKQVVITVKVIFVNELQIPPKNIIRSAKKFEFARMSLRKNTRDKAENILSAIYDGNMQVKKERNLSVFHNEGRPVTTLAA